MLEFLNRELAIVLVIIYSSPLDDYFGISLIAICILSNTLRVLVFSIRIVKSFISINLKVFEVKKEG